MKNQLQVAIAAAMGTLFYPRTTAQADIDSGRLDVGKKRKKRFDLAGIAAKLGKAVTAGNHPSSTGADTAFGTNVVKKAITDIAVTIGRVRARAHSVELARRGQTLGSSWTPAFNA